MRSTNNVILGAALTDRSFLAQTNCHSYQLVSVSKPNLMSYLFQCYMSSVNQVVILAGKPGMTLLSHNKHNVGWDIIRTLKT